MQPIETHEDRRLAIQANTPLLELVLRREQTNLNAIEAAVRMQLAILAAIAAGLGYMKANAEWVPFMKFGAVLGIVAVIVGMSHVWRSRTAINGCRQEGFEIEEGLSRITTLFSRHYKEATEAITWRSRQVDIFHGILLLGWILYFLYRHEPTSRWILSFFVRAG